LKKLQKRQSIIKDIRGRGLLIGMELSIKAERVVDACMKRGFLINGVQESILRFAPPLIVQEADIDALVACLDEVLKDMTG